MSVSKNVGTPKSSILIGVSIINHPFWGPTPIFGNIHIISICCFLARQLVTHVPMQSCRRRFLHPFIASDLDPDLLRSSMDWPRIPSQHVPRCQKPQLSWIMETVEILTRNPPFDGSCIGYPPFSRCFFWFVFSIRIMPELHFVVILVLPRLEISKPRYDYYVQVVGWRDMIAGV